MNWTSKHWEGLTAGVIGAGLVAWWMWPKSANASEAAVIANAQQSTGNLVILQPGAITVSPPKGTNVTFRLPVGASWISSSVDGGPAIPNTNPADGPTVIMANDDFQVVFTWRLGTIQTTTVNVVPPGS